MCARCADRPERPCGRCGRTRRIARRAHDGIPDICDGCFRMPEAVCSRCQRRRPCSFAAGPEPVCIPMRATGHRGLRALRRGTAHHPRGGPRDPSATPATTLRSAAAASAPPAEPERRLVAPPGPDATTCADCAGTPTTAHTCTGCGLEDKLYEKGRCAPCALRRRTRHLLRGRQRKIPPELVPVYQAITTTDAPRTALNWLRNSAGAGLLAEMAFGTIDISHETLDAHPRAAAAGYLRALLVANNVLPARDEQARRRRAFPDPRPWPASPTIRTGDSSMPTPPGGCCAGSVPPPNRLIVNAATPATPTSTSPPPSAC